MSCMTMAMSVYESIGKGWLGKCEYGVYEYGILV